MTCIRRHAAALLALVVAALIGLQAQPPGPPRTLPLREGATRFAVIGDMGTGSARQRETADTMAKSDG